LQIETATVHQDTLEKPYQQYLQALREWYNNKTAQSDNPTIFKSLDQFSNFPEYQQITKTLHHQHLHWQIDTIEILLNRNETIANISKMVQLQKPIHCNACNRQKHPRWNCPQTKKQAQSRRYGLSKNKRKDNQMGDYACREPFQLLKDTFIPQQVFDLYEKDFIPFHCD